MYEYSLMELCSWNWNSIEWACLIYDPCIHSQVLFETWKFVSGNYSNDCTILSDMNKIQLKRFSVNDSNHSNLLKVIILEIFKKQDIWKYWMPMNCNQNELMSGNAKMRIFVNSMDFSENIRPLGNFVNVMLSWYKCNFCEMRKMNKKPTFNFFFLN